MQNKPHHGLETQQVPLNQLTNQLVQLVHNDEIINNPLLQSGLSLYNERPKPYIVWLKQVSSTNDWLKAHLANLAASQRPIMVIADTQTQGRGQAGRTWLSPPGNVYLSAYFALQQPIEGRLALEVALSILNMPILAPIKHALKIKWPNDLYGLVNDTYTPGSSYDYAKWGGILIEPVNSSGVIIGIGLNCQAINCLPIKNSETLSASLNPTVLNQPMTHLSNIFKYPLYPVDIIPEVILSLYQALALFNLKSPHLTTRFNPVDYLYRQLIQIETPYPLRHPIDQHTLKQPLTGTMLGINPEGALLLDSDKQIYTILAGHVRRL